MHKCVYITKEVPECYKEMYYILQCLRPDTLKTEQRVTLYYEVNNDNECVFLSFFFCF